MSRLKEWSEGYDYLVNGVLVSLDYYVQDTGAAFIELVEFCQFVSYWENVESDLSLDARFDAGRQAAGTTLDRLIREEQEEVPGPLLVTSLYNILKGMV